MATLGRSAEEMLTDDLGEIMGALLLLDRWQEMMKPAVRHAHIEYLYRRVAVIRTHAEQIFAQRQHDTTEDDDGHAWHPSYEVESDGHGRGVANEPE